MFAIEAMLNKFLCYIKNRKFSFFLRRDLFHENKCPFTFLLYKAQSSADQDLLG
jgi:hypothetical protein